MSPGRQFTDFTFPVAVAVSLFCIFIASVGEKKNKYIQILHKTHIDKDLIEAMKRVQLI